MTPAQQRAQRIAEWICTDPQLTERCIAAQSEVRTSFRATQAAMRNSDSQALSEQLARRSRESAAVDFAQMHMGFCDECDRHESIADQAAAGLLTLMLDWYGFAASLRSGPISVAEMLARRLESNPEWLLERLERRLEQITA